ncbi:hypothetical protein M404DRAFT_991795 [Pisolithus tinctorius Marx 270]|uniref:Uncharacterized protein n=1 Tax=Pisolithus tinctorius Marx 270 TaxID=870435 RepID=A0A0C3PZ64_PISTI|nr:hypothetical protein M404DRAFT_991795 [Pisolithus tinctorius Marx 270]
MVPCKCKLPFLAVASVVGVCAENRLSDVVLTFQDLSRSCPCPALATLGACINSVLVMGTTFQFHYIST